MKIIYWINKQENKSEGMQSFMQKYWDSLCVYYAHTDR